MKLDCCEVQQELKKSYVAKYSATPLIPDSLACMSTESIVVPGEFFALALDPDKSPLLGPQYSPVTVSLVGDVFARDVYSESSDVLFPRYVTLSGEAGMGKTTQIGKLLLDWGKSEEQLAHYDFIFYISLCTRIHENESLSKLLCGSAKILPDRYFGLMEKILDLYQSSDRLLFILDDYTAVKNRDVCNLINGTSFPNATILISGRPGSVKIIDSQRHPDVSLDLLGIPEKCVESLVLKLLGNNQKKLREFMSVCEDHLYDSTLLRRPFFTVLMCCAFYAVNEMKLEICQHQHPITTTELFHVMLRASLKIYLKRKYPDLDCNVAFDRSPLLDKQCRLPAEAKRLLYQFGKLSFKTLKKGQSCFTEEEIKSFYIDLEEVHGIGLFKSVWDGRRNCEKKFEFCHKMFQEYFAALYITAEPDAFLKPLERKLSFSRNKKHGTGSRDSCDTESDSDSTSGSSSAHRKFAFMFPSSCRQNRKKKIPVENEQHPHDAQEKSVELTYFGDASSSCFDDLKACPDSSAYTFQSPAQAFEHQPSTPETLMSEVSAKTDNSVDMVDSMHSNRPNVVLTLVQLVHPYEQMILFASGISPEFTYKLLGVCWGKVALKVCQWNPNKYDVGFEALLFCEVNDVAVQSGFYTYLLSLREKRASVIQFPSPFDEVATVRMVGSFSREQASHLMKFWYNVDLSSGLYTGANITSSVETSIDLNDPCLVEVLLLHKFQHFTVEKIKVVGNYFSDFSHMLSSFPNVKELVLQDTNIAIMKASGSADFFLDIFQGYVDEVRLHAPKLHVISVCGVSFSADVWRQFLNLISTCSVSIQKFSLKNIPLDNMETATEMFCHMQECQKLQWLQMVNVGLSLPFMADSSECVDELNSPNFCSVLKHLGHLQGLDLSENPLAACVPAVLHAVKNKAGVRSLVLQHCQIPATCWLDIAFQLRTFQLEELDVSNNSISDGAKLFLENLKCHWQYLKKLHLANCGLTADHFTNAGDVLCNFSVLEELDLSYNHLGSAINTVAAALPKTLKTVILDQCNLLPGDIVAFAHHTKCHSFTVLKLTGNEVGNAVHTLMKNLRWTNLLRRLDLTECQLMPTDMKHCCEGITKLKNLQEVCLGQNTCCDLKTDCRADVVKLLTKCRQLQMVDLTQMHGTKLSVHQINHGKQNIANFLA